MKNGFCAHCRVPISWLTVPICDGCLNDNELHEILTESEKKTTISLYHLILQARSLHFYNSSSEYDKTLEYDKALIGLLFYATTGNQMSSERAMELIRDYPTWKDTASKNEKADKETKLRIR